MAAPRFHLSIPAVDLEASERWYVEGLGCTRGRRSEHAVILDLGGHQVVAQRSSPEAVGPFQAGIYPRHFGLVFEDPAAWEALLARAREAGLRFGVEPRLRFPGQAIEHRTFFLIDPSGNWLEFKCYSRPEAALGCPEVTVVGDSAFR